MKLQHDPKRKGIGETRIFIRAQDINGKFISCDIAELTRKSLLDFLRSRGGDNPWAEDCVGIILGHEHLHEAAPSVTQVKEES